ncbi:MAG: hypothetical protein MJ150_04155 [Clostridia bacterium]|nr:hypothetical protein [Clostridia bacterium]
MKTYKEMADDALSRISQYEIEKQNKRKKITKIAAPVVSCCLVVAVCIGMWQGGTLKDRTKLANTEDVNNGGKKETAEEIEAQNEQERKLQEELENQQSSPKSDNQIIASGDEDIKGSESSSMDFCIFWWKNKISMYGDLYWVINDNPNGTFAVTAKYRPAPQNVTGFTYEGKTLYQLAVEADNERMMPEKMMELLKVGDELKYGTALYETGTPDGIRWDRVFYEEQVLYFGNLLDKYIVDGSFLADQLKNDIEALQRINVTTPDGTTTTITHGDTSARDQYARAYRVYLEGVLDETAKILSENNIKCERAPYSQDSLNIVVTADELENLSFKNMEFWVFGLTNNNLKGSQPVSDEEDLAVTN